MQRHISWATWLLHTALLSFVATQISIFGLAMAVKYAATHLTPQEATLAKSWTTKHAVFRAQGFEPTVAATQAEHTGGDDWETF